MKKIFLALLLLLQSSVLNNLHAENNDQPIVVKRKPAIGTHTGPARLPMKSECPFELFYNYQREEITIVFIDEVSFFSYNISYADYEISQSNYMENLNVGELYSIQINAMCCSQICIEFETSSGSFIAEIDNP